MKKKSKTAQIFKPIKGVPINSNYTVVVEVVVGGGGGGRRRHHRHGLAADKCRYLVQSRTSDSFGSKAT